MSKNFHLLEVFDRFWITKRFYLALNSIENYFYKRFSMTLRSGKKKLFWAQNNFFVHHHLVFLDMKHFFVQHQLFLSTPNYFLCNIKLFVSTQNCFLCSTKLLFWTLFKILRHGDISLLSRSNKNIITCQRKIKFHSCVTQKNNFAFFVSQIFYIQFLHFTLAACWSSS